MLGAPPPELVLFVLAFLVALIWAATSRQPGHMVRLADDTPAVTPESAPKEAPDDGRIEQAVHFLRILRPNGPWVLRSGGKAVVAASEETASEWLRANA